MNNAAIRTNTKRISNRARMRLATAAMKYAQQSQLVLVTVLAQLGGDITVTQGTIDQCAKKQLAFHVGPGKHDKEFIVKLVESEGDGNGTE